MVTLSEPPLGAPALDGLGDLDWTALSPWLMLLKLLSLAVFLVIYRTQRRRRQALRGAIAMVERARRSPQVDPAIAGGSISRSAAIAAPSLRRRHATRRR